MAENSAYQTGKATAVPLGSEVVLVISKGPATTHGTNAPVPGVVGRPQADALEAMQQIGLNPQVFTQASPGFARGMVVSQWPKATELAASGSNAALLVSAGVPAEGTALTGVPTVVGSTEADARATLERVGLHSVAMGVNSATVPDGIVLGQLPEERMAVPPAKSRAWLWVLAALALLIVVAGIVWLVSRGGSAQTTTVPDVVGLTQSQAETTLTEAGLVVGTVTESPSTTATAGDVMSQDPAEGATVDEGAKVDLVVAIKSNLVAVPNVVGMSKDEALQALGRAQLTAAPTEAPSDAVAAGKVVSQSPKAGQEVPPNTQVGIVVSSGPSHVSVPNVTGLAATDATQKLDAVGLLAQAVDAHSSTVPVDTVISQVPPAGTSVVPGTTVQLLVSSGPAPSGATEVKVPNVVGKSLADATTALESAGLKVASVTIDGSGKPAKQVVYQTPAAGESVPRDSEVALLVSSGK